ncbi:MAG: hypothetical protein LJF06_18965 [Gemmatimonadetes bacterium]|nr:hypothetical protein [Gemmatimonadota bacterium]
MRHRKGVRSALTLAVAALATACANSATGPQSVDPATQSRWDMDLTVRYLHSSPDQTCNGVSLLGLVIPAEFQYRITATYGSVTKSTESKGYGTVTGESKLLSNNETWNFANQTWTFDNMKAGDAVDLTLYVTVWDGVAKDGYMNNRSNTLSLDPSSLLPTGGTKTGRALGVGKSTCGLTLYYDVTVRQRQVSG